MNILYNLNLLNIIIIKQIIIIYYKNELEAGSQY